MKRFFHQRRMRKALRNSLNKLQRRAIEMTDKHGIESSEAGKAWRQFNDKLRSSKR